MRLKSFYAKTMSEAMQMVRNTLGEDAVIVATREERGGAAVRVTAAIDPAFEVGQAQEAAAAEDWLQYDNEQDEAAIAEDLTETMLYHGAPEDVTDNIISCATVIGMENPAIALSAALEHLFHFRPLPNKAYKKHIMMVGPPGSGKTLTTAKLAARSTMSGLKVGVISADTMRAGGVEQLAAFTKLLQINLKTAKNIEDLPHLLNEMQGQYDQIIIDTPSTNPFQKDDIRTLAKLVGNENIDPYLILPSGMDASEAGEMARAFTTIGAHTLITTRIDISRRLGSILAAAHSGSLAFSNASNTPKVADGFMTITPDILTKLLMPNAFRDQQSQEHTKTGTS